MNTYTPEVISDDIMKLCRRINKEQSPFYIDVVPDETSRVNDCFANVGERVKAFGGSVVYGWQIWEWSGVLVEAEFHAVWRKTDGSLLDITPKQGCDQRILFLPDPSKRFDGERVDNIRMPLSNDPNVAAFIKVSEDIHRVLNKGSRRREVGLISIPESEILPLMEKKKRLLLKLRNPSARRNAPCHCGSGKKYKKCCGAVS